MLSIGCAGTNILNSSAGAGTARGGSQRSVSHSRLEAPSSKYNNNRATVTPGAVQNHQYANADSKHRRLLEGNNFSSNSTNLHCSSAYLQQPGVQIKCFVYELQVKYILECFFFCFEVQKVIIL